MLSSWSSHPYLRPPFDFHHAVNPAESGGCDIFFVFIIIKRLLLNTKNDISCFFSKKRIEKAEI